MRRYLTAVILLAAALLVCRLFTEQQQASRSAIPEDAVFVISEAKHEIWNNSAPVDARTAAG